MTIYNDPDLTDERVDALAADLTSVLYAGARKLDPGQKLTLGLPRPPYLQGLRVEASVEALRPGKNPALWIVAICLMPSARNATSMPSCLTYSLSDTSYMPFEEHVLPAVKQLLLDGDKQVPAQVLADAIRATGLNVKSTLLGKQFEKGFANMCLSLGCRPVYSAMSAEHATKLLEWVRGWCDGNDIKLVRVDPDANDSSGSYAAPTETDAEVFGFEQEPDPSAQPAADETGDAFDL
jgi:hypothetical protein